MNHMKLHVVLMLLALTGCGHDEDLVGGACFDDRDCVERCERDGDFPGGFCTVSCVDDQDCPFDTICTATHGDICLFPCDFHEDCDFLGPGYFCREQRDTFDQVVSVCMGD